MPKLNGGCTTTQGRQYQYEVTWSASGPVIMWSAKVRHAERLVAVPTGEFRLPAGEEIEAGVRAAVEWAIEHRLTLDEP